MAGDTRMKIERFVAKYRLDAKATAKLENSSERVAERIVEAPMGHVNNQSTCLHFEGGGRRNARRRKAGCEEGL